MSETDPGRSVQGAGDVGAHRATVGTPTERESINVPPTRPGAADNAREAELAREEHETFIPEAPVPDERSEAVEHLRTEEESMGGGRADGDLEHGADLKHGADLRNDEDLSEEDAVRRDIQETRRQMGETVSQLAGKADVKGRAGHAAEAAKDRASHAAETAKVRAVDAADTVKHKASDMAGRVREGTPDRVKDAGRRPVMLVAAAGAVTAIVVRRMMKRRTTKRRGMIRIKTR